MSEEAELLSPAATIVSRQSASVVASRRPCGAPRLNVALARLVDLKAALLAEARAQGSHSEGDHCSLLLSGPPAAHTQSLSAARRSAL